MINLNNIGLKKRLQGGFLLVAALLILLAGIDSLSFLRLENATSQLVEEKYPQMNCIQAMEEATWHLRGSIYLALLTPSKAEAMLGDAESQLDEADAAFAKFKGLPLSPETIERVAKLEPAWANYKSYVHKIMGLIRSGDTSGATAELGNSSGLATARAAAFEAMNAISKGQREAVESTVKASRELATSIRILGASLAVGGLILALTAGWFIGHSILGPVEIFKRVIAQVAEGDLRAETQIQSQDELGEMGRALDTTIQKLREDMTALIAISERTAASATQLAATSTQLEAATQEIAQGAESQRVSMESASRDISQLALALDQVHTSIVQANELGHSSSQVCTEAISDAKASNVAMDAIQESAQTVSRITTVITEIARQTNLLSLNAAIEAAKAGSMGRGFAVVAEEIRKLAERSATAAKEIAHLIEESVDRAQAGNQAVAALTKHLHDIEENTRTFAGLAHQASQSIHAQVQTGAQIRDAADHTFRITDQNASASEELASSITDTHQTIHELAHMATQLREMGRRFQIA